MRRDKDEKQDWGFIVYLTSLVSIMLMLDNVASVWGLRGPL